VGGEQLVGRLHLLQLLIYKHNGSTIILTMYLGTGTTLLTTGILFIVCIPKFRNTVQISRQCCGFRMFILDPGSKFFQPAFRVKRSQIQIRIEKLSIFKPKSCF
jgi:hypothetical protein